MWLVMLIRMFAARNAVKMVSELPPLAPGDNPSQLAVVIAARNEGKNISDCLTSLLKQTHPNLKIIAVNDRSTDNTGQIIDDLAARNPEKIEAVHITELPEGWLGKCNALQTGAAACTEAEFILFMDGDVKLDPDTLSIVHRSAQENEADQVCVVPDMTAESFWEQSIINTFVQLAIIAFTPARAMRRHTGTYVGVGAFNMVRTSLYRKIKEHNFLRMQIIDDLGLGKLIKFAGGKVHILSGRKKVTLRWQESAWDTVRGLEKNFFAFMNYNSLKTIVAATGLFAMYWLPWIMVFVAPFPLKALWITALAIQFFICLTTALVSAFSPAHIITGPFGSLMMTVALLRSMIITLRQGGVRWRENFYPLKELKKFKL